jgi:cobalt-precorrin-5B (C1)-methyltransferase
MLIEAGYERVFSEIKKGCEDRIRKYLKDENFNIEVIIYSMEYGKLD